MNTIGKLAVCAGLGIALSIGVGIPRAAAQVHIGIGIGIGVRIAPPAPLWEPVPGMRVGFFWSPGYWRWGGRGYLWVRGSWQRHRAGYDYVRPRWVYTRGAWRFDRGFWRARARPPVYHRAPIVYRGYGFRHDVRAHDRDARRRYGNDHRPRYHVDRRGHSRRH